jgi:hypothetical protein
MDDSNYSSPKPITPKDLDTTRRIPDQVINIVNDMIRDSYDGSRAIIEQDALLEKICLRMAVENKDRQMIFDKGWLNFEKFYEKAGWKVKYFSPDRGETGRTGFSFEKKPYGGTGKR